MPADDPQKELADLRTLLEVSRQIGVTIDTPELLGRIVDATLHVLSCERASVFLYDKDKHELYSVVAAGTDEIRFSADAGIAGEAVCTGALINVPDAYADSRFNQEIDRKLGFRTRNLLTLPLTDFNAELVGVLQAINKAGDGQAFTAYDEQLALTLAAQAGVAIQRQMLLESYAIQQRTARDLELARRIQQASLPTSDPSIRGFDIAGWNRPADETGGDCYDFLMLDGGRLGVVLADAVGHGIGAALIIAECRALLRAVLSTTQDLPAAVGRVNALLYSDLQPEQFVTAFIGILDPAQARLSYVSAGQGPLLQYRAADQSLVELPATSFPLAIVPDGEFLAGEPIHFEPGDLFILLTDGFHEWQRPRATGKPEQFGMPRVREVVQANADKSARAISDRLYEAVRAFGEGTVQNDDLTIVIIKSTPPSES